MSDSLAAVSLGASKQRIALMLALLGSFVLACTLLTASQVQERHGIFTSSVAASPPNREQQLRRSVAEIGGTDPNGDPESLAQQVVNLKTSSPVSCRGGSGKKAAVCTIVNHEEAYLDEWVDYHLAIGFEAIVLYDNSEKYELRSWAIQKRQQSNADIRIQHQPGALQQRPAYSDCARQLNEQGQHEWVAFFDVDEFLVMKRHDCVSDLLRDHCSRGALSLSWRLFGSSRQQLYTPLPVTKRFVYRQTDDARGHTTVKTISRLADLDFTKPSPIRNPHYPELKEGISQHDTNGKMFMGAVNVKNTTNEDTGNIAVVHHYHTKSRAEYICASKGTLTLFPTKTTRTSCKRLLRVPSRMGRYLTTRLGKSSSATLPSTQSLTRSTHHKRRLPLYARPLARTSAHNGMDAAARTVAFVCTDEWDAVTFS